MRISISLSWLLAACMACHSQASPVETEYYPVESDMDLPFSNAVRVGNLLFLSGAIGLPPGADALVAGGIQPETRQTMENIKASLQRYGSSLDRVVKCTVFLADIGEWAAMNEVYRRYFEKHLPARSALGASGLALGARVEIECVATVPSP